MAGEWQTVRIVDVVDVTDFVANGSFESLRNNVTYRNCPDYAVLVRLVDHNAGWGGEFVYVDKASYSFLKKSSLNAGDVVIANVGANAGSVFRVPNLGRPMTLGPNSVLCKPRNTGALSRTFLYYFLTSTDGQDRLRSILGGSAQPKFNKTDLRSLHIPLPEIEEQRAIAHILRTLDDKIELNRRMNETLEAMARALFQSWFVDFDPVQRNIQRAQGHTPPNPRLAEFDALFPDALEESALGEIPKGWQVKAIAAIADVVGGSTPSTKDPSYWEGGTHHWATPKDLSSLAFPVLLDTERKVSDAGLSQISSGLLPVGTVLLSSRAPIGYLVIAEIPVAINQGFIAMKAKDDVSNLFLLLWARAAHEDILSRANGSTFLEISKSNFRPIQLVSPSAIVMEIFERQARPLYQRIVENERESRTLAALRDTLLPKLISGALRVKDAEWLVGMSE